MKRTTQTAFLICLLALLLHTFFNIDMNLKNDQIYVVESEHDLDITAFSLLLKIGIETTEYTDNIKKEGYKDMWEYFSGVKRNGYMTWKSVDYHNNSNHPGNHTYIYLRNVCVSVCLFVCVFVCLCSCPPSPLWRG